MGREIDPVRNRSLLTEIWRLSPLLRHHAGRLDHDRAVAHAGAQQRCSKGTTTDVALAYEQHDHSVGAVFCRAYTRAGPAPLPDDLARQPSPEPLSCG